MTSRLDRLFILLESGSSAVTRRAAAKQIGEVQKLYPHELHALLNRLIGYLHSTSWDTRIAASQAVEAILQNVPAWKPELYATIKREVIKKEKDIDDESAIGSTTGGGEDDSCQSVATTATTSSEQSSSRDAQQRERLLSFAEFDLEQILHKGARLIGSEGIEFDLNESDVTKSTNEGAANANATASERLSRQRALLNEKLGLTQASKLGVNLMDMITDEDVMPSNNGSSYNANEEKVPVEDILNIKPNSHLIPSNGQQLSCREMNRAKRKARQNINITTSGGCSGASVNSLSRSNSSTSSGLGTCKNSSSVSDEPEHKKMKADSLQRQEVFYTLNDPVPDATGMWVDAVSWPLENFCARLYVDLFNPRWEVRHGAATALRELINNHCNGAGKAIGMSREEIQQHHNLWMEDAALRLLCVLCLDRFGDFVSDQVVAPVRETCAQVLGTIVKDMHAEQVHQIVQLLMKLLKQKEWEVRHGGLLGLKYVFVVREDLLPIYVPQTISNILLALFDVVDDVGAVAASTLIPIATWLPKLLNPVQVSSIVKMLWDLLLDQDELTSACNSFMGLLAAILCLPNAGSWIQMEPMSTLIPRLWPFLSHSTSSVRKSTLLTLQTLTASNLSKEKLEATTIVVPTTSSASINNGNGVIMSNKGSSSAETTTIAINFDSKKLNLNLGVIDWQWKLLQDALRFIYERILVEHQPDIQEMSCKVWNNLLFNADLGALLHAACPIVSSWICLAMQPARLAFDSSILIHTTAAPQSLPAMSADGNSPGTPRRRTQRVTDDLGADSTPATQRYFLGGSEGTPLEVRERNVIRARVLAARVLGALSKYLVQPAPGVAYTPNMESPMDCYTKVLLGHLNSRSAVQRIVCGLIIAFWAQLDPSMHMAAPKLAEKLLTCVMEYVYYDEVAISFTRLHQEAHDLIATLKQYKIVINDFNNARVLTLDQIEAIATTLTEGLNQYALKPKLLETLEERRRGLQNSFAQTTAEQCAYNISAQAALAAAIVGMQCLPEKLNPIVKPLMESIKREECELLQNLSAEFLVQLMHQVCDRNPSPNSKIFTNLCTLLRSDPQFTPKIILSPLTLKQTPLPESAAVTNNCVYYGILTLSLQQNNIQIGGTTGNRGVAASAPRGPGRPPLNETLAAAENGTNAVNALEAKQNRIQRMGASCAISKICLGFKMDIFSKIPVFQHILFTKIEQFINNYPNMELLSNVPLDLAQTNDIITSLQLIEIVAPHFLHFASDASAKDEVLKRLFALLPHFSVLITHPLKAVRHMVARCIAALAAADLVRTMHFVLDVLLGMLVNIENVIQRQGAIEAIERVVDKLQLCIVPYTVLLVVPLLGCMSDPDESVRLLSTHCFATLIQLMPLDSRSKCIKNEIPSAELQQRKIRDREFLDYLFTPKSIPDYKVPVTISVELRSYQQAGVNWLWFLNKYNLHGILCDDMGLGKTLQTICILAGDHYQRQVDKATSLPSLVICPPTLTGHWVYEIEKFIQKSNILRPLHYVGLPIGREKLRCQIGACNLVVASYDTVRKDIDFFSTIHWNYCVLDEGHIIKNGKTKSSKAIKTLKAKHRLILSGTPIQNNVLELWSLFDFLMPGFLGTEKQFIARYSRPILASRDSKSSSKEQEAGVLAMEALHRQVLPFLLRRVKEDVLTDLPPKITQDLLCELSPLQERLYEDFSRTHLNSHWKDCLQSLGDSDSISKKAHIFHDLRYLQNVCNHPKLVLTPKHSEYGKITLELQKQQSSLDDIEHSAKLPALKQLLLDCGIGVQTESVSQHRALIFCQLKAMLNIVENDLLRKHLPSVTYLRLDGSVPASLRQQIVNNFNTDPSIDVLLLTTQVGGLGLNLTGADTVIFVEHDWNPMKDLQAMDRAHRIGQKKVVNVYRLITEKTLEEKIMGLQKFKILTANTVVSSENASLETMGTGQLFDLFNANVNDKTGSSGAPMSNTSAGGQMSMNAIIESLPELWSEQQYDEEYDVSNFVQGLKK
ncbi:TATA-binding protein-associated factor 172 [Bactrocera dorsalis]|uniref:TATA-binding protein-associated factor 172 n=1 Tax=Bactrocera dorsalis TaxID=27457 RepID=A0A6I9VIK0_BACDO|nr:TATA-binding protein-associated factor 172 [Bactrocera dorsalis]XP_011210301.2 TATA-binding protein-associated factor 172 [Bactrocera dorsalis]XP_049305673.1 TATA-binding protein-associated factor 172 [Bactrocera dorsalis]XP_049305674.1 TATA-binding protein-associated factor 172 [Bactrocera dorsalis]